MVASLTQVSAADERDVGTSKEVGSNTTIGIEIWGKQQPVDWYTFTVTVQDEEKNPLQGVVVRLYPVLENGSLGGAITGMDGQYLTDSRGQQKFQLPPPGGTYQIQTQHAGYEHYRSVQFQITSDGSVVITLIRKEPPPKPALFTVRYRAEYGGHLVGGSSSEQVTSGSTPRYVPTPVAESGYQFLYWMDQDGWVVEHPSKLRITSNTTFYACFEEISRPSKYTVHYQAGRGGRLEGDLFEIVTYRNSPRHVPTPVAESGWSFKGWEDGAGHLVSDPTQLKIVRDTWLYARFEPLQPAYTVYYHAETGGSLYGVSQEKVLLGEHPKSVPKPVAMEGYRFAGWADQYGNTVFAPTWLTIASDTWLYARFELFHPPKEETHTVYYWAEEGGVLLRGPSSETVTHGGYPRQVPTPAPSEGYRFVGWMDQRGKWVKNPFALPIMEDTWLRACFEEKKLELNENRNPNRPHKPPTTPEGDNTNGGMTIEPETELPPQEGLFDVPVGQMDQIEDITSLEIPSSERETTCILHWIVLACMVLSTAGGLLRLGYLVIIYRRGRWNDQNLEKVGICP